MPLKIDQRTTRAMNRRLILNLLRREGSLSRADVAVATGLSPAAVTFVVSDLIAENYIVEGEALAGTGGRRPIPLSINYAGHLAIGIKMNVGTLEGVLTDLSTAPLASLTVPNAQPSPEGVVEAVGTIVDRLMRMAPDGAGPLTGVGFSMPGTIDLENGICVRSHRFFWEDVPFARMLQKRVRVPVWMEDDTLAFALAQHLFGLGRQHQTFTVMAIGVGIGCATVSNGVVHRGAHGQAGKLGHILHRMEGPLCECGRHGCLQAFYAEPAIVDRWRRARGLDERADRYAMKDAALQGDPTARAILREAGEAVGVHLAGVVDIIDPELVIVGGEAVTFGDLLFEPMRRTLDIYCFTRAPAIVPDEREHFWSTGAAALATQGLFNFEVTNGGGPEDAAI